MQVACRIAAMLSGAAIAAGLAGCAHADEVNALKIELNWTANGGGRPAAGESASKSKAAAAPPLETTEESAGPLAAFNRFLDEVIHGLAEDSQTDSPAPGIP